MDNQLIFSPQDAHFSVLTAIIIRNKHSDVVTDNPSCSSVRLGVQNNLQR